MKNETNNQTNASDCGERQLCEVYEDLSLQDYSGEDWVDCVGFDGMYLVSNFGRIKSVERWRPTYGGRGYVQKEKIRKLVAENSCIQIALFVEGKRINLMVSRLVFFSFNRHIKNLPEYFVVHKDNNWKNNQLQNLKIGTREEIGDLTFKNGKMNHLKLGNPNSTYKQTNGIYNDGKLINLKCFKCGKEKPIRLFYSGSNECSKCCSNRSYYKRLGLKRKHGFEIKATEIESGIVTIYKNCKDPELSKKVSNTTAIKYARNGEICTPKPQSKKKFLPFRLEFIFDTEPN